MKSNPELKITVDEYLTQIDKDIITQQLINQEAETEEERVNFTLAYIDAKRFAKTNDLGTLTDEKIAELVLQYPSGYSRWSYSTLDTTKLIPYGRSGRNSSIL